MTEAQATKKLGREYETVYVLRPDISKENAERVASRVVDVVGREGGMLTQVENWGRRQLAYPIAKQRRGYYVCLKYMGNGALVSELERNFRMLDDVIRYQTVKVRDEVDLGEVAVKPEDVEFEAIEPPPEDERDDSLARRLGLEDVQMRDEYMSRMERERERAAQQPPPPPPPERSEGEAESSEGEAEES